MEHSRNGDVAEGRDGDANGNQAIMMDDEQELTATSDGELYFRHHPFTKQFTAALHSLLVSSSRQEVMNYFAQFQRNHQRYLYKVFALTVMQVRENVAAEFRAICKETQILEALDHINSEEFLRATEVRQSISPKEVVREVAIKRKQEEVNVLKQKLLQTKEENDILAAQLEGLQEKVNAARDLRSVDAVIQKISTMNLKLAKVIEIPFSGGTCDRIVDSLALKLQARENEILTVQESTFLLVFAWQAGTAFEYDELSEDDDEWGILGGAPTQKVIPERLRSVPVKSSSDGGVGGGGSTGTGERLGRVNNPSVDKKVQFTLEHSFGGAEFSLA